MLANCFFDSLSGIKAIVAKSTNGPHTKWIAKASRYKLQKQKPVPIPAFLDYLKLSENKRVPARFLIQPQVGSCTKVVVLRLTPSTFCKINVHKSIVEHKC